MPVQSIDEGAFMNYRAQLIDTLWGYAESEGLSEFLDRGRSAMRPPVFWKEHVHRNLLSPERPASANTVELARVLPKSMRHRWFGSGTSSQALTLSVFGNLKLLGCTHVLRDLVTEDGLPFVDGPSGAPDLRYELEHEIDYLGEPRKTSVDVLVEPSPHYRIAVECKLSEREVGSCSRPRLTVKDPNYARDHCDGSYAVQRGRKERCSLTAIGVRGSVPRRGVRATVFS